MMIEYHYTEEPKQALRSGEESICRDCYHNAVCRGTANQPCIKCNQYIPAADVRPMVRGKWIKINGLTACSVCKENPPRTYHNYCPNCGAKMDGGTE